MLLTLSSSSFGNVQCQTLNEEEIFEVQDRLSLFPLGWIHVSSLTRTKKSSISR